MMERMAAASATERAMGPTVSWCSDIGTTGTASVSSLSSDPRARPQPHSPPSLDVRPTVGLMPTKLLKLLGHTIDPSVSVPSAAAASPIALPMPLPELDPHGSPRGTYGLLACPPRPEKPEGTMPRKFAHSDRLAFPSRIAPAARSAAATWASRGTTDPRRAKEPAVVFMPGEQERRGRQCMLGRLEECGLVAPSLWRVAMLSLSKMGMPWRGPRAPVVRRSASSSAAWASALGLVSMTARSVGPCRLTSSIRAK